MNQVLKLATEFRLAIDAAKDADEFLNDICFHGFPCACCGDASDLLAQYLLDQVSKASMFVVDIIIGIHHKMVSPMRGF